MGVAARNTASAAQGDGVFRPTAIGAIALRANTANDDEIAAVRAAVVHANSETVWGDALRRGDAAPLVAAWEGEPLTYFSREIQQYRDRGLRLLSTLVELEFLEVTLDGEGRAVVSTRERWHDRTCTDEGELRAERWPEVLDRYELVQRADGWRVTGVDITSATGSLDWTPAADSLDGPSPCAAVLTRNPAPYDSPTHRMDRGM
jgi:hypothetical protein